jgi:hypothetical protein
MRASVRQVHQRALQLAHLQGAGQGGAVGGLRRWARDDPGCGALPASVASQRGGPRRLGGAR